MTTDSHLLTELVTEIIGINPLQRSFIESSLKDVLDEEMADLGAYINYGLSQDLSLNYLAQCYDLIVKDTLREQLYFQRHKRYRYSTFAEVARSVYFDDAYMRKYMHGLALTSYLWPNHREMHRYFARSIPKTQAGYYIEIGPGHGMYMMTAMRQSSYSLYEGIDLSPTSVDLTQALLGSGYFGLFKNYRVFEQDFLHNHLAKNHYRAVVMGEVLEHVEAPEEFLRRVYDITTGDAFIFITTPINAPAIDHIFLFDSFESIESIVVEAGLSIRDKLLVPYPGQTLQDSLSQALPVNAALILSK